MLIDLLYTKALADNALSVRLFDLVNGSRKYWNFTYHIWDDANGNNDEPSANNRVALQRIALVSDPSSDYYFVNIAIPSGGVYQIEIFLTDTHEIISTGNTQFEIATYSGPISFVAAPPALNLQILYGYVKQLGLPWAEGDLVSVTPNAKQSINSTIISNKVSETIVNDEGAFSIFVDKGVTVTIDIKRNDSHNVPYFTKTITITNDDTKNLSTY